MEQTLEDFARLLEDMNPRLSMHDAMHWAGRILNAIDNERPDLAADLHDQMMQDFSHATTMNGA